MFYHLYGLSAELSVTSSNPAAYEGDDNSNHDRQGVFPPHITIFDSAPGCWSYSSSQVVLAGPPAGMTRTLLLPLVHLLGMWWAIKYTLLKVPEETYVWGLAHNDLARAREACRSYIRIAKPMSLFYHQCVEKHADHVEANGYVVVSRVSIPDSQHVAHARSYPDKYRVLIRDTWGGRTKDCG
ncbi:uncharacterized protein K444DRAFT_628963 [Hyaloscypha bicolor E]|uniref:Uncharacterized protein n=1 Tax=Hyaloscypha bicolor E TaxID=1095630 RepID=A0A2J6TD38_9HELO|nr:uncharacterized protein K444DRAFT_628963 [Hyaloscypha bicolor E]PMD60937.1 hypothetical protein K444DRAFT_628963 [Hyaloscypha bicolor E]